MNRFPNRFFDLIVAILILRLFSPSAQPLRFERSNLDCGSNATALEPNFFNPPRLRGALVYWPDVVAQAVEQISASEELAHGITLSSFPDR